MPNIISNQVLFVVCFVLFASTLTAQKEDYQWPLGSWGCDKCFYRFFFDFNTDPPSIKIREDSLSVSYSMACFSDSNGQIRAYSNGLRMLNANGEIIENSEGLNPNLQQSYLYKSYPVPQNAFFLRKPGQDSILYYFHMDWGAHDNPSNAYRDAGLDFRVTRLDLRANNGAGKVLNKNEVLVSGFFTQPTAVRHANGRDWWILVTHADENKHYRFLLDPNGISGPWLQEIGTKPSPLGIGITFGNTFSPSGNYYVDINDFTGFSVFDFDRCSGLLSNERRVDYHQPAFPKTSFGPGGGATFSPDDRFLYVSLTKNQFTPAIPAPIIVQPYLLQYDLVSQNIEFSADTVNFIPDSLTASNLFPQLEERLYNMSYGPDGRIYIVYKGGGFSTVRYPNAKGKACDFRYNDPFFDNSVSFGLPNLPNYRLGPVDGSSCDSLGIQNIPVAHFRVDDSLGVLGRYFYDLSYHNPTEWSWTFGDGTTSQESNPLHVYTAQGAYQVCLTASNLNGSNTSCRTIFVGVSTVSTVSNDFSVQVFPNPASDQIRLEFSALLQNPAILELRSVTGQLYRTGNVLAGSEGTLLDVRNLPAGMYFLTLSTEGRAVFRKFVIVLH